MTRGFQGPVSTVRELADQGKAQCRVAFKASRRERWGGYRTE